MAVPTTAKALKVGPDDSGAIRQIANSLRRRAGQIEPAYSTRQIIDACFPGTLVTGRALPVGVNDVVVVDEAAFRSHRAPHVIVYGRGMSTAEQRHAIAHALGHIVFDGAGTRCSSQHPERELRCDRFADELLVPLEELRPYVARWPGGPDHETYLDMADQIASHFQVTASLVDQRIRRLRALRDPG